ncbi:MAG TPA: hypothetical protein VD767_03055 [Thermomicrobiales bacterium]|nr:hypothetical protein [Thermomicrobiales bacterium]
MFSLLNRFVPASFKSLMLVSSLVLFAVTSSAGALAIEDPNAEIPDSVENPLAEMCDDAVETFFREIDWILSHDADDPRMDRHVDSMWDAWYFAEVICRIDVGGNGELG